MPDWVQRIARLVALGLAAWTARNSTRVPLDDWQFLVPAMGTAVAAGANPIWAFVRGLITRDGLAATLRLVERLIPYREKMLPQEVRDAIFNALRYRFAADSEAVALVDLLVQHDMQLADAAPKTSDRIVRPTTPGKAV